MIQRIQTLFLLVATIFAILLLFVPVARLSEASTTLPLFVTGIQDLGVWYLTLLFVPCIAIPFFQIFLFKNRKRQLTIGKIGLFYWFLWTTIFLFICYFIVIDKTKSFDIIPAFGAILPVVSIGFFIMANKAIKKDEDLVRSIDRIR
jgi:hypothetical protein